MRILMLCIAGAASGTAMAGEDVVYLRAIPMCNWSAQRYRVVPAKHGAVLSVPKADVAGLEILAGPEGHRCYVIRATPSGAPARYEVRFTKPQLPATN